MQETSEATPTQTPLEPLTAEVAEQVEAETQPAPEPAPEEPEAPGPSPAEEVAPTPFATLKGEEVADEYALLDHELVRPHFERQLRRERESLQEQYNQAVKEAKENLEAIHENRLYANYIGNLLQKLREEDLPGADAIAERFANSLEKKERHEQLLGTAGEARANAAVLKTLDDTLGRREQDQFDDWRSRNRSATWKDIFEQYVELRAVTSKKPLQDEVRSLKAENEQLKQRLREGKGPDLTPKGGGGETDKTKARRDYAEGRMSTDEAERLGIV